MKRNILFIDPPGAYSKVVNTGLGYIASSLKNNSDCNFKVLDMNNFGNRWDDILQGAFHPDRVDGVGISVNVGNMHAMPSLLQKVKCFYPKARVFLGGSHVYLNYRKLLSEFKDSVDFAVIGETENTISRIVEYVEDPVTLSSIPGVALKGNLKDNISGERLKDIDSLDFPSYEYFESVRRNNCSMKFYPIMTSRGCPYACTFCAGPKISGKNWRFRKPESVVDEIEFALKKYKTQDLEIFDDNFLLDKERAMEIIELILKRGIKMRFKFGNGVRADKLDEDNVKIMKRAGLHEVGMGIESADEDIFRSIKKGESFDKIENAIRLLRKYDIHLGGSFIIGLPGSTLEKDIKSVKFANRMQFNWRYTAWCYFTPYPSTDAYDTIRKEIDEELIEKSYRRGHFTANFIQTEDYPLDERIIVRSLGAKIPPVHPDYSKWSLLKLFLKMELVLLRYRDRDLGFLRSNLSISERMLLFVRQALTRKINKDAYF